MKLATSDEMRAIDRRAIEGLGIPGIVLMENAALAVVRCVEDVLDDVGGHRVHVVAGKGNNGGDGLAAARQLHVRGYQVSVTLLGEPGELKGDALTNFTAAQGVGVPIESASAEIGVAELSESLLKADVCIDAILGTGISGEVAGSPRQAIEAFALAPPERVVAVDVPSGIHADTGQILGCAVRAGHTVTFGLPKVGLYVHPAAACAGEVIVDRITLPDSLLQSDEIRTNVTTDEDVAGWLPPRLAHAHKGDCGRVLIVAGSVGLTGAAAMAGMAAVRAGAGLVTVACPESVNDILEVKLTEAMTIPLPETPQRSVALAGEKTVLAAASSCDVVVAGPGVSRVDETMQLMCRLAEEVQAPLVVDADGLYALAEHPEWVRRRRGQTVLTPHPGEMSRLTGQSVEEIQRDRLAAARAAAERFNAVVVLKGAGTVTARPDGAAYVNPTGNAGMATGGTGDVLSGLIGGLIAQGMDAFEAAVSSAYLHGLSG
ncbi:MAG: NAD(P)H-hydrate dehydratase, partial [Armatimonadota bacterium]